MKRTAIMLAVLGAFLTGSLNARADSGNPFGFETNKHPLEYKYCKKEPGLYRGHGYKCSSAPRPHPDLDEYALLFVEDLGLCFIGAIRQNSTVDMVETLKSQIAKKYGLPTKENRGAKKRQEKDMRDTHLPLESTHWNPEGGFKGLGDVQAIELKEYTRRQVSLALSFWLITHDACLKKIDDKEDRAF